MRSLNLRKRLLIAVGLIAVLQVVIAFVVVDATRDQLTDQVDDRLTRSASSERDAGFSPDAGFDRGGGHSGPDRPGDPTSAPERLSDTYEGALTADGTLVTFFAPNSRDVEVAPPAIDLEMAAASENEPQTVNAADGSVQYRVLATPSNNGSYFVTAIPLDTVNDTVAGLTTVVALTVAAIMVALAFVAGWVVRLGIAPIKRMTATAEAIAAGDLSERIVDADPRTEAGQLGHALNTMLGQIETSFDQRAQAEDKLRQFIADASHELRTPVATIRGYAELYRVGGLTEPSELDDAMRRTEQESERMSRLISDMLNLAKLDRDPTVQTKPVDLGGLARDAAADAQATHPDRGISASVPDTALMVDGDEDLLRQVLANVIENAVMHTSSSTSVDVAAHARGSRVVLTVADDGEGMSPDDLARAKERFFRADPSRRRHKGGSGLGLAIADSVIRAHNGSLEVDSTPAVGTTVTIDLPVRDGESRAHSSRSA